MGSAASDRPTPGANATPAETATGSGGNEIRWTTPPTTIEEAVALNPALAADLACRDEQAKFSMDYHLRLLAGIRDCLSGRTRSTGNIQFMMHFDNDPATGRGVGTELDRLESDLDPADDEVVVECVNAYFVGSIYQSSPKHGGGPKRWAGLRIDLPLENSWTYKMVREGSYAAGTDFGCEVP